MRGIIALAVLAAFLAQTGSVTIAEAGHGGGEILRVTDDPSPWGHGGGEIL